MTGAVDPGTAHRTTPTGRSRITWTARSSAVVPQASRQPSIIDSFSFALRKKLSDTGVTVTCLMPGATETRFFERAGLLDTTIGQEEKDDLRGVAKAGFDRVIAGEGDVVSGWKNKIQLALANVTPAEMLATHHRKMAEPGSGNR